MYRTGWNDTHRFSLFPLRFKAASGRLLPFIVPPRSLPFSLLAAPYPFLKNATRPKRLAALLLRRTSARFPFAFSLISRPEQRIGPRYVWHVFMPASLCVPCCGEDARFSGLAIFSASTQAGSGSLPMSPFPADFQPKHPIRYRRTDRPVFISNPVRLVPPRLFPNRFPLKSPSFSDAKLVCSRERPAGLDQWRIVQIFLYRASRFGTEFPK